MFYYKYKNNLLFSMNKYTALEEAAEQELASCPTEVYYLTSADPCTTRRSYCVSDTSLLQLQQEDLQLLTLKSTSSEFDLPAWIVEKTKQLKIKAVNTSYPNWLDCLDAQLPGKWRINLVGLGDVGSNLLLGLKLLGEEKVSELGIFDIDQDKIFRWEFESNQILFPNKPQGPKVFALEEKQLFDCDMFVFCVTVGIPPVDSKGLDVRMIQFEGNAKIIAQYAKKAREAGFKGIFAVVSDPVDLLCKKVLLASNTNDAGQYDFKGLAPEQIRGYGLGVMHARAAYYAAQAQETLHYLTDGRAFGPHGEHLIIADSIDNYNEELSMKLTQQARTANLELRSHGYKPYVAPALSSGAIAILDTISSSWHYSATYIGGVYMGARNRLLPAGIVLEQNNIPLNLMARLTNSYKELKSII